MNDNEKVGIDWTAEIEKVKRDMEREKRGRARGRWQLRVSDEIRRREEGDRELLGSRCWLEWSEWQWRMWERKWEKMSKEIKAESESESEEETEAEAEERRKEEEEGRRWLRQMEEDADEGWN